MLIFVHNLSPLYKAAEDADFHNLDPDTVGVAGDVAKIKVACNLVHLTRIPVVCMTWSATSPLGVMPVPEQNIGLVFVY